MGNGIYESRLYDSPCALAAKKTASGAPCSLTIWKADKKVIETNKRSSKELTLSDKD